MLARATRVLVGATLLLATLLPPRAAALSLVRRPGRAPRGASPLSLDGVCVGETATWLLSSPAPLAGGGDQETLSADAQLALRLRALPATRGSAGTQLLLELTPLRAERIVGVLVVRTGPAPTDRLFFALRGQPSATGRCARHAELQLDAPEALAPTVAEPASDGAAEVLRDPLPWEDGAAQLDAEEQRPRDDSWLWNSEPAERAPQLKLGTPPPGGDAAPGPPRPARPSQKPTRTRRAALTTQPVEAGALGMTAFSAEELRELERQPWVKMKAQRIRDLSQVPQVTGVDLDAPRQAPCRDHREATRRLQRGLPMCPDEHEDGS